MVGNVGVIAFAFEGLSGRSIAMATKRDLATTRC
jgi:hypothetical protein